MCRACRNFRLFNGLHGVNSFSANGNALNLALIRLDGSKSFFGIKGVSKTRATLITGDELLSYSNDNGVVAKSALLDNGSVGVDLQPEAVAFGALSADNAFITNDFSIGNDDRQLDCPSEGFSSIPDAIEDIRRGKVVFSWILWVVYSSIFMPCCFIKIFHYRFSLQIVVVVDDEDRENEGDLIMAAELATPEAMAFIVKHGTGIVCASMKGEDLDRLQLPLMVRQNENDEKLRTAFTVTVVCTFLALRFHI